MQKLGILLLTVGIMIASGMGLLFYGSQMVAENLATSTSNVIPGDKFEITKELDSTFTEIGIYVVQTMNFKEDSLHVTILDPSGNQIVSKSVSSASVEDSFEIPTSGTYSLIIENSGNEETMIFGGLGNLPDTNLLSLSRNVTFTGLYLLIVGMIGVAGVGIYMVVNRRKKKFS